MKARLTAVISTMLFLVLFGFSLYGHLMRDSLCLAYLGCNAGFFGYDGLLHLVSGIAIASGLVWMFRSRGGMVPNVITILAFAALVGVMWEAAEYAYDWIRIAFFHIDLVGMNVMAQPSNADTMGDLILSLAASLVTVLSIW